LYLILAILATWEAEIGRITVHSQPGQNLQETPISTNNLERWLVIPSHIEV
jgi:hypothetical protein